MPKELSEADEADHRIIFRTPGAAPKTVRAAYVTTEDKHPDMLAFKDHANRTVCLIARADVLTVERQERQQEAESAGFRTTTQVMEQAGIKPESFR